MMMNTKVILGNMLLLCLLPVNIIFALCFGGKLDFLFVFFIFRLPLYKLDLYVCCVVL